MSARFKVNGKSVTEGISRLVRILGKAPKELDLSANKDNHLIVTNGDTIDLREAVVRVPCDVDKSGMFRIELSVLQGVCKNRGDINFWIKDSKLNFKTTTGYSGSFNLITGQRDNLKFEKLDSSFNPKIQKIMLQMFEATSLNPSIGDESIPVFMQHENNKLTIASADQLHAAIATVKLSDKLNKKIKLPKDMVMPTHYTKLFPLFAQDTDLSFQMKDNSLVITTNLSWAKLPGLQMSRISIKNILDLANNYQSDVVCSFKVEDLKNSLNNVQHTREDGVPTVLELGDKHLSIRYDTTKGRSQDRIDLASSKGKIKINMEIKNLEDVISKLQNGEVELKLNKKSACFTQKQGDVKLQLFTTTLNDG